MPRLELQTAMISAFELCKKKAIPIQFAAKVPRLGTIGKNHIQSRFNLSEESVLFFCSESDTFLRNYTTNRQLNIDLFSCQSTKIYQIQLKIIE